MPYVLTLTVIANIHIHLSLCLIYMHYLFVSTCYFTSTEYQEALRISAMIELNCQQYKPLELKEFQLKLKYVLFARQLGAFLFPVYR